MGLPVSRPVTRTAGTLLLTLVLLAGAIYSFALPAQVRFPDEGEYLQLSGHLVHGPGYSMDGVHLTASRPPGYPFFLAAIEAVGGGMPVMRLAQFLFFGATLLLVARFSSESSRGPNLLIVTGVVMLYPVLFYTSATLYPQTLAAFFFMLALTLLLVTPRGSVLNLFTGLAFGALLLIVPTFALTMIVVLAVAWVLKMIRWHDSVPILVGAALLVSVWTARNFVVFHQIVPFASNSGANLLIGNCENTIPYGGSGNVDRTHYEQEARALGLDEFQEDRYYQKAAITWIKANPGRALVLYLEKTANYFNVYNEYARGTSSEISPWKQLVMAVSYILLLALLAWRLAERKRFPLTPREKLFLIIYVASAFTMAIFVTRIRYRLPYDYLIIAVIAMHLSRRLESWLGPATMKST